MLSRLRRLSLVVLLAGAPGCERKLDPPLDGAVASAGRSPPPAASPAPSAAAVPSASAAAPSASASSGPLIEPALAAGGSQGKPVLRVEVPALGLSEEAGELPPLPHACLGTGRADGRWVVVCSNDLRTPRLVLTPREGELEVALKGAQARRVAMPAGAVFAPGERLLGRAADGCGARREPAEGKVELNHQHTRDDADGTNRVSLSVLSPRHNPVILPLFVGKGVSLRCKAEGDATQVAISCGDRPLCRLAAGFGVLRLTCGDDEAALLTGCQSAPRLPRGVADRRVVYD